MEENSEVDDGFPSIHVLILLGVQTGHVAGGCTDYTVAIKGGVEKKKKTHSEKYFVKLH